MPGEVQFYVDFYEARDGGYPYLHNSRRVAILDATKLTPEEIEKIILINTKHFNRRWTYRKTYQPTIG